MYSRKTSQSTIGKKKSEENKEIDKITQNVNEK